MKSQTVNYDKSITLKAVTDKRQYNTDRQHRDNNHIHYTHIIFLQWLHYLY